MSKYVQDPASFRDPSGFIFKNNDGLIRTVNKSYRENFDLLLSSRLYEKLTKKGLLIPHKEIKVIGLPENGIIYKTIKPDLIPFVSYPYEWSYGMLLSAAYLTLDIQSTSFEYGMSLKDASAFNVQFRGTEPV